MCISRDVVGFEGTMAKSSPYNTLSQLMLLGILMMLNAFVSLEITHMFHNDETNLFNTSKKKAPNI